MWWLRLAPIECRGSQCGRSRDFKRGATTGGFQHNILSAQWW